jgi:hypothetical protein
MDVSLALREERRLRVFKKRFLRRIFWAQEISEWGVEKVP